jgi:hypothetical protein
MEKPAQNIFDLCFAFLISETLFLISPISRYRHATQGSDGAIQIMILYGEYHKPSCVATAVML